MNSLRSIVIVFVLVVCALLLIIYRSSIGTFFERLHLAGRGVTDTSFSYETFLALKRDQVFVSSTNTLVTETNVPKSRLRASIYSRYPFTDRGLVVIARGARDGITVGMPVLSAEGALIGIVRTVRQQQSEVQTIFDPEWRNSVAIGSRRVKAVIRGGNTPQLELIPKDEIIDTASAVVNISPELPFNLPIGTVEQVVFSSDDAWQTAKLTPYIISNEVLEVFVETDFP